MTLQTADSAVRAAPLKGFTRLTVGAIRREADAVVSLLLSDPDGGALPVWEPGAHVDVLFANGILRQYSLCSDPAERTAWRVAVLREQASRGGSSYVHEVLRAGDTVEVRGPKDNFRGTAGAGEKVFIAGGIGITPLLPMIREANAAGEPWRLLYLGAGVRSMAFLEELAALDPAGEKVRVHAKDQHGGLELADYLAAVAADATVHACGPSRLLAELRAAHAAGTLPHLRFEDFGAEDSDVSAADADAGAPDGGPAVGPDDSPFVVETADGLEIDVAAGETILDALQRAGVPALNSCRKGTCGTCETVVLEGIPDHRDDILGDEERALNETMMICVSRCHGERLVLDI
ncbi:PDR/VanB family oxidoreductase [Arthrobacter sp. CJ23]|uniref:PDR/VanB family oxidoreductase n=1 Tax=Arthrobacter sp. CJ23 TaxID=2972479 RepID=UPI00215BB657|nr:PDR/VanB family oxidoreductase [Arthrobacter sp. CJ23]UVJ40121.1 PDR/VanB family oxidoreductase [Arthrobacter sp. CJ23]